MNKIKKILSLAVFIAVFLFLADHVYALSIISKGTPPKINLVVKKVEFSPGYKDDGIISIEREGGRLLLDMDDGYSISLSTESEHVNICKAGFYDDEDCKKIIENYSGVGDLQIFRPDKSFYFFFDNYMETGETISIPDWEIKGEIKRKNDSFVESRFVIYGNFNVLPPSDDWPGSSKINSGNKPFKILNRYTLEDIYGFAGMLLILLSLLVSFFSVVKYFVSKDENKKAIYFRYIKLTFIIILFSIIFFNSSWKYNLNYYNYDLNKISLYFSYSFLGYVSSLLMIITGYGLLEYLISIAKKDNEGKQKAKRIIIGGLKYLLIVYVVYFIMISSIMTF